MKILDLTAGNRAVWFNKQHSDCLYLDIRPEVYPDIVCDARNLPFKIGTNFDLIIFDPPHVNVGSNGRMKNAYGHSTTEQIRDLIIGGAKEAYRISSPNALMSFKWNTHGQKLATVLALMKQWWEPLVGHKVAKNTYSNSKHNNSTTWVLLKRK